VKAVKKLIQTNHWRYAMKKLLLFLLSGAFFLLTLNCGSEKNVEVVEDIVQAVPEKAKLIFENDYVKAVLFDLKPGDKLPMHTGGPRIIYSLSDYKIKWSEGGQESEKEWKMEEAHWHEAVNHAVENTGETDAKYLVVTRKGAALPAAEGYDLAKDASQLDMDHAGAVFENDHVRLIEVQLQMAEKQPIHHGLPRLIYALTPYTIKYTSDQMEEKETVLEAGTAHWHTADEHSVENIGETLAHYLIFEFKK